MALLNFIKNMHGRIKAECFHYSHFDSKFVPFSFTENESQLATYLDETAHLKFGKWGYDYFFLNCLL